MIRSAVALAVLLLALAGCAAAPEPAPTVDAGPVRISPELSCKQFANLVLTPIANARLDVAAGRMTDAEALAVAEVAVDDLRVSVEAEPNSAIDERILLARDTSAENMLVQPAGSEAWIERADAVGVACETAGFPLAVNIWTGG